MIKIVEKSLITSMLMCFFMSLSFGQSIQQRNAEENNTVVNLKTVEKKPNSSDNNTNIETTTTEFDGSWQIQVPLRQKNRFKSNHDEIVGEIVSVVERHRSDKAKTTVNIKGYDVLIMSKEDKEKGVKWHEIYYLR